MKVIAHRGNSGYFKENSFDAILSAINKDVDYIEIDLRQTKDDVIIVFHDANLKRLFSEDKTVNDITYDELSELVKDKTSILKLSEFLKLVHGRSKILFEIKSNCDELLVYNELNKLNYDDYIISSFGFKSLIKLREVDKKLNLLFFSFFPYNINFSNLKKYDIKYIGIKNSFLLNSKFVNLMKTNGVKCFVFTPNTKNKFDKCIKLDVEGIITDYPFELAKYLKENKV